MICDKDCFHCPYPDCINETMDAEDYQESREREDALLRAEGKAKIARGKEYYDNNRAKIAEKSRAYYASHREYFARYRAKYYAEKPAAVPCLSATVRQETPGKDHRGI